MIIARGEHIPATIDQLLPHALLQQLERLDLATLATASGRLPGERRSKQRGRSVEFDDYRPYTPGDDPRHIDWNVLARFDRLVVKLFREDQDLTVHLLLDTSASMLAGRPSKLAAAARLLAALAALACLKNNRVLISAIDTAGTVRTLPPLRGRRGVPILARFIIQALAAASDAAPPLRPLPLVPGRSPLELGIERAIAVTRGRGVLVLISDLLAPGDFRRVLNLLASPNGFEAHLLRLLAQDELDPTLAPALRGDLRLTDIETGRAAEVTIVPDVLARAARSLRDHIQRVEHLAAARGVRHTLITSDADPARTIADVLTRARLLRRR